MSNVLKDLSLIRNQLVSQQAAINGLISKIDFLLVEEIQKKSPIGINISNIPNTDKRFPAGYSKRDKLKHILKESKKPLTAKEIKEKLSEYNEILTNVDQSLVNLEKDKLISSANTIGRKQYFIKDENKRYEKKR